MESRKRIALGLTMRAYHLNASTLSVRKDTYYPMASAQLL